MKHLPSDVHGDGPYRPFVPHRSAVNGRSMSEPSPSSVPELVWQTSYERAGVNRFLAAVDVERQRLQTQIGDAKERVKRVRAAAAAHEAGRAELAERFLAVQRQLEALEADHRQTLDAIEAEADQATERLISAARDQAAAMRAATTSARGMVVTAPARRPGDR